MKRKLLSLILCLCLAVSIIPAPVAAAEGRGRNPFNTAGEMADETVNNLEGQPTETPEKTQEDYASKTIDNKSFTQSKTDIKTSDNISRKSIDNKTTISMPKKAALGSTQGTTEVTLGENGAETFYAAFELCRDNGGIIHITRDCDTSEDNQSERQDTLIIYSDITLDIQAEANVSGNFEIQSGKLTITGNGTFAATCTVEGGILNIESGHIAETAIFEKYDGGEIIVSSKYVLIPQNDVQYKVKEAVCIVDEKSFATLGAAIDEADGNTITVIANINETININKQTIFSLEVREDFCVSGTGFKNNGASITIKNGKFDTPITNESGTMLIENGIFSKAITNNGGTISITGGTFLQDVSNYCAEGYECQQMQEAGKYQVVPIIEARILDNSGNEIESGTLSAMLEHAIGASQTVQLLRNCDYSQEDIYIQKTLTFDINGYTLNTKSYHTDVADTIDSVTLEKNTQPGILTSTGGVTFKAYNTYMPMIDNQADVNGYRFFNYSVSRFDVAEKLENDFPTVGESTYTLKYKYALKFKNTKGYDLLAQDNNAGVVLIIGVSWDGEEHLFNLKADSLNAVQKYAQFKQNDFNGNYSMFVRFWNYNNTLKGKTTGYRLHVWAVNGTLMMKETSGQDYTVKGYTEETES